MWIHNKLNNPEERGTDKLSKTPLVPPKTDGPMRPVTGDEQRPASGMKR